MSEKMYNEQEQFWEGQFGDDYIERNCDEQIIASNAVLFAKILSRIGMDISSILELGCNIGNNLVGISKIMPNVSLHGVEINAKALAHLEGLNLCKTYHSSIKAFSSGHLFDLVFTKGVLIHIPPVDLPEVYKKMYELSSKYILMIEYYNQRQLEINYRGHTERLWKRDFAGEMMDLYPNLTLVDYGFEYHRDKCFPQNDDMTWFLLRK